MDRARSGQLSVYLILVGKVIYIIFITPKFCHNVTLGCLLYTRIETQPGSRERIYLNLEFVENSGFRIRTEYLPLRRALHNRLRPNMSIFRKYPIYADID